MNFATILFIAVGLSMDAFAVSITNGMMLENVKRGDAIKVGLFFGLAQAVMPLLGWLAGINFRESIEMIDHWIALILLGAIGDNMIYESIKTRRNGQVLENCEEYSLKNGEYSLDNKTLFLLAIATSIDALAIGISFAVLNIAIIVPIVTIGIITFVISYIGVLIGDKCGPLLKNYAELIGGIILILIGLNIFIEHTIG